MCAGRSPLIDETDPAALASALTSLGAVLAHDDAAAQATAILTRARGLPAADPGVEVLCLNYLSITDPELTDDERIGLLRNSLDVAEAAHEYEGIARAYTNLGELYYRMQRYDALDEHLAQGFAFVREHGFWSHTYNLEVHHALLRMRRGDWAGAESELGQAVSRYQDPGMLILYSLAPLARLHARRGEPGAEADLRRCWQLAQRQRMLLGLGFAATGLLEWAWLEGRPDVARDVMGEWHKHVDRPTAAWLDAEVRRYAVRAGVDLTAYRGTRDPVASPWTLGLRGDWRAAAAAWRALGDDYEAAVELADSGVVDAMVQALRELTEMGARLAAALVRGRLADLGVTSVPRGPIRQTRANPAGLTPRQLDVAYLLADGLTNAEIAERLYLSVRTVDHHVASILLKLEVPNRRRAMSLVRGWFADGDDQRS